MESFLMIIGFVFAAYAVVGNDAIQTLGTFLSSNSNRPWWVLWLFSSTILVSVILYGWYVEQDISYEKFGKLFGEIGASDNSYPEVFNWWLIIPPIVLLFITQFGIPVSTTFLILSLFSFKSIDDMVIKSLTGYVIAFVLGVLVYVIITRKVEQYFIKTHTGKLPSTGWVVLQWCSTGFLWSMWLLQDMVNIFVYLYRPLANKDVNSVYHLAFATLILVTFQGILFYFRGGEIQKIVTSKTNTKDIRSATIIDFIYGLILFYLKGPIPLSTTWVFVGILAGREFGINIMLRRQSFSSIGRLVAKDLVKVVLGLAVSVALVLIIRVFA